MGRHSLRLEAREVGVVKAGQVLPDKPLVNLGRLRHEAGEAAIARVLYERALQQRPEDPIACFNLGVALEDLGRTAEAIAAYEQAIAIDDLNADAHFNLAGLYERKGDKAGAVRELKAYARVRHE